MFTLAKRQQLGNYIITFQIKEGDYAETYRVKDAGGKNRFLKLINCAKLHRTQFDADGNILEVQIAKLLEKNPAPSKEENPMAWTAHMNSLTATAEESILTELVYS